MGNQLKSIGSDRAVADHPLVTAIATGDIRTVVRFIDAHDINLNGLTCDGLKGQTLLHIAAENNQAEMVRFLTSRGARPDVPDGNGRTALIAAVWKDCSVETVDALLSGGALIDSMTPKGHSAFHVALLSNNRSLYLRLLRESPNLNTKLIADGITPFHTMVESSTPEIVNLVDAALRVACVTPDLRLVVPPKLELVRSKVADRCARFEAEGTRLGLAGDALRASPLRPPAEAENPDVGVTIRCGSCRNVFGTCACTLSVAPCYTPGRWKSCFIDASTASGDTPLATAAVAAVKSTRPSASEIATMLALFQSNAVLEELVA